MTRRHKTVLIITAFAMFYLLLVIIFGDNGLVELSRMRMTQKRLAQENGQLTHDNLAMYRTVDRLQNDPAYIENVARRELGMIRADEFIFKFSSEDN